MCIRLQLESYFGIQQSIIEKINWNYNGVCKQSSDYDILQD